VLLRVWKNKKCRPALFETQLPGGVLIYF